MLGKSSADLEGWLHAVCTMYPDGFPAERCGDLDWRIRTAAKWIGCQPCPSLAGLDSSRASRPDRAVVVGRGGNFGREEKVLTLELGLAPSSMAVKRGRKYDHRWAERERERETRMKNTEEQRYSMHPYELPRNAAMVLEFS